MATVQRSSGALGGLTRRLEVTLSDVTLARRAARLVNDHAADPQLALATMLKLTEDSAESMQSRRTLSSKSALRSMTIAASQRIGS